jgi:hypothetical protein
VPDQPDSYANAKLRQLDESATLRVYGRALDFEGTGETRWMPVHPCFCVHDAPDNPCPCPKHIIWWLRRDTLFAKGDTRHKDHDSNDLQYFDVQLEATIMVEMTHAVSAAALKRLGTNVNPRSIIEIADGGDSGVVRGANVSSC